MRRKFNLDHEELIIDILKVKSPKKLEKNDVDKIIQFSNELRERLGDKYLLTLFLNPSIIISLRHLVHAIYFTFKSIDSNKMISKNPCIETLLYLALTRQIRNAIDIASLKEGLDEFLLVIASKNDNVNNEVVEKLKQFLLSMKCSVDDIDDVRLQTLFLNNVKLIKDRLKICFEDIDDIEREVLFRMAIFDLSKY